MAAPRPRPLIATLGAAVAAAAVALALAGGVANAPSSAYAATGGAGLVLLVAWLRPWRLLPFLALRFFGRSAAVRATPAPKGGRRRSPRFTLLAKRAARRAARRFGAGDTTLTGPLAWRPPLRDLLFRAHGWFAGAAFGVWLASRAGEMLRGPFHATRFEALADVLASCAGVLGGAVVVLALDRFPPWVAQRRIAGRIDGRAADAVLEFGASVMTLLFVLALGGLWAQTGWGPPADVTNSLPAAAVFDIPLVSLAALAAYALSWLLVPSVPPAQRALWIVVVGRPSVARGFALPHLRLIDALASRWREGPVTVLLDAAVEARGEHALAAEQTGRQRLLYPTLPVEVGDWAQAVPPPERWTSLPVRELHPASALMVPALKHWLRASDVAVLIARSSAALAPWRDPLRHTRCMVAWLGPQTVALDRVAGFAALPVRAAGLLHDGAAAFARPREMLDSAAAAEVQVPPSTGPAAAPTVTRQQAPPAGRAAAPTSAAPGTFARILGAIGRLLRVAAPQGEASPAETKAVDAAPPSGPADAAVAARLEACGKLARVLARVLEEKQRQAQTATRSAASAAGELQTLTDETYRAGVASDSGETPRARPTCFVVQGLGPKTDYTDGRVLDLDASYQQIKQAAEEAGLQCMRADEIIHAGTIDVPMYEQLLGADLVIADLSTYNLNAAFDLGVRYGLRPYSTIVLAEEKFKSPFDDAGIVIRRYTHLGEDIGRREAVRLRTELKAVIGATLADARTDSPVYLNLPLLIPPRIVSSELESGVTDDEPPVKNECFVIQGFGSKMDYTDGRILNLDASYEVIRGAAQRAGLDCVRADEMAHDSGRIRAQTYEQLLTARIVIADLSTYNFSAAFELGVRFALRPSSTLVVAEDRFKSPFDATHISIRRYRHLGEDLGRRDGERFASELTAAIVESMAAASPDSPVYRSLPGLVPPRVRRGTRRLQM